MPAEWLKSFDFYAKPLEFSFNTKSNADGPGDIIGTIFAVVRVEGRVVKKSHFSIAVKGKGMLLGSFISYGCEAFPNATWYDRSDAINAAIGVEVMLAEKGLTREQDRAMAKRAAKNLANPKPTDVTATFSQANFNNTVVIEGRRRPRTLNISTADLTLKIYESAMDDLIDAVKKVL